MSQKSNNRSLISSSILDYILFSMIAIIVLCGIGILIFLFSNPLIFAEVNITPIDYTSNSVLIQAELQGVSESVDKVRIERSNGSVVGVLTRTNNTVQFTIPQNSTIHVIAISGTSRKKLSTYHIGDSAIQKQ